MISTVSGPRVGLTQLITRRKVGRPEKERAGEPVSVKKKAPHEPEDSKVEEDMLFYAADPTSGLTVSKYTPTGQYLDTYA